MILLLSSEAIMSMGNRAVKRCMRPVCTGHDRVALTAHRRQAVCILGDRVSMQPTATANGCVDNDHMAGWPCVIHRFAGTIGSILIRRSTGTERGRCRRQATRLIPVR